MDIERAAHRRRSRTPISIERSLDRGRCCGIDVERRGLARAEAKVNASVREPAAAVWIIQHRQVSRPGDHKKRAARSTLLENPSNPEKVCLSSELERHRKHTVKFIPYSPVDNQFQATSTRWKFDSSLFRPVPGVGFWKWEPFVNVWGGADYRRAAICGHRSFGGDTQKKITKQEILSKKKQTITTRLSSLFSSPPTPTPLTPLNVFTATTTTTTATGVSTKTNICLENEPTNVR